MTDEIDYQKKYEEIFKTNEIIVKELGNTRTKVLDKNAEISRLKAKIRSFERLHEGCVFLSFEEHNELASDALKWRNEVQHWRKLHVKV